MEELQLQLNSLQNQINVLSSKDSNKQFSNTIIQNKETVVQRGGIQSAEFSTGATGWRFDADGNLEANAGHFRGDVTGASGTFSGVLTGGSLNIPDITSAPSFHVDNTGNIWSGAVAYNIATNPFAVSNAGVIRAISGTIANWNLSTTALSTGAFDTLNTMYFGTSGLSLSNTFKVTPAGALTATGATISGAITATSGSFTGSITATSGTIGGFTLSSTALYAGTGATRIGLDTSSGIYLGATTFGASPFSVSLAGALTATNATITGTITANTGYIGGANGWVISSNYIKDVAGVTGLSSVVTAGDDIRFWAGHATPASAPFYVTESGALVATSATITGAITATSGSFTGSVTATGGTIGGWDINSTSISKSVIVLDSANDKITVGGTNVILDTSGITAIAGNIGGFTLASGSLYGGIIKTAATVGMGNNGVIMDTDGIRGYSVGLGNTFNIPTDGSAPTFSSGIINYTTFNVDVDGIIQTSETVGDGSASSAGILINNTGFYACEANQTSANANVKILVDGTAYFNASIRGGQTDFNTGIGYFLGLSGGDYKFSIGSPAGNYMTWDGTYLKIKGSFDVGNTGLINNAVYTNATLPVSPTVTAFLVASAYE